MVAPTVGAGWSVAKIVSQVHGRTENRAANKPNFEILMEFFLGLDEFCQERHFWWRRKTASFQTVANQQDYNLSDSSVANAPDVMEIEELFVVNGEAQSWPKMVRPDFTPRQILQAIYGQNAVQAQVPQAGYFLIPGEFQQLSLDAPPDSAQTMAFVYWACPMVTDTANTKAVPLVPPPLHWGLIYVLERRVYEYLYGQNDPRFVTSNARYQEFVEKAAKWKQFSSQEAMSSRAQMHAVHSSGGRGSRGSLYGNR